MRRLTNSFPSVLVSSSGALPLIVLMAASKRISTDAAEVTDENESAPTDATARARVIALSLQSKMSRTILLWSSVKDIEEIASDNSMLVTGSVRHSSDRRREATDATIDAARMSDILFLS